MRAAVLLFPGLNRENDAMRALQQASGVKPTLVWHAEHDLPAGTDVVVVPGGFSYGDYLRCGAIAGRANIMNAVRAHAARGGIVLGICNGFQVLCESGLLPGALLRNAALKYVCKPVELDIVRPDTRFTRAFGDRRRAVMTVGNGEGAFFADGETLARVEGEGQVVFRYVENPNGSLNDIAGLVNAGGNVLGLMPHPDRSFEPELGSADGALLFQSLLEIA